MSMITLQNSSELEVTILSNWFIDNYMPEANGEFVKVYIYLLRILTNAPASFSLEHMADRLLCTERDILRALKYWEKEKLLTLSLTSDKKISGIVLHTPSDASDSLLATQKGTPAQAPSAETPQQASAPSAISQGSEGNDSRQMNGASSRASNRVNGFNESAAASPDAAPSSSKYTLTPDRVKELKQNEDIIQLLYIAEQYLGKTLTPTEMQKILFFYDELKMSTDLIEYLIEYCVGRNHKSMRYIETVALSWAQEGITTVKMAKDASSRYMKEYYTILKAMGISNRNPVEDEITYMDTWMKVYGFTMDIIQEACSRTVLQAKQPSFKYAEKILSGWKDKNVKNLDDIRVLDAEHKKRQLEKSVSRQSAPKTSKAPNRFNNFHQREYDFDEYEKKLLNH